MLTITVIGCRKERKRKKGCGGTVVTDLTMKEPQVTIEHIHPADNAGVQVAKVVRMKKLPAETREKPAVIIAQALQRLPDVARSQITARRGTDVSCPLLDIRTHPSGQ